MYEKHNPCACDAGAPPSGCVVHANANASHNHQIFTGGPLTVGIGGGQGYAPQTTVYPNNPAELKADVTRYVEAAIRRAQAKQHQEQEAFKTPTPAVPEAPEVYKQIMKALAELTGEVVGLRKEVAELKDAGNSFAKRHRLGTDFRAPTR